MEILIKATQFLMSLSLLIVLHELGHFLPARYFGIRVEKFYLFFDIKWSIFKKKIGDTVYGIGWLPLGGYVKIAGMIDESMDKEQMKQPVQDWEFRSKPAWQRVIVMLGGVTVNFILAVVIYAMIFFVWGDKQLRNDGLPYGLAFAPALIEAGFEDGDRIVALEGETVEFADDIRARILSGPVVHATVERGDETVELSFEKELGQVLVDEHVKSAFQVNFPTIVLKVNPGSAADEGGLQVGDQILTVAGASAPYFLALQQRLMEHAGEADVEVGVMRDGEPVALSIDVSEEGTLGFNAQTAEYFEGFGYEHVTYGAGEALSGGWEKTGDQLSGYVSSMRFLFKKGGAQQLGGFITLGSIFSSTWDWQSFWSITAFLSLILGFMNLLPIPALDGGHVMFLLYEIVSGRKPSDKVMEFGQLIGLLFVGGLLLLANGNDLWRWATGQY
jgi:regulator of sigma E protease